MLCPWSSDMLNLAQTWDLKEVLSILERNYNTYESAHICKIPWKGSLSVLKDGWGGPWQRKQGNGIGWGWQGHLATDFSSCCWNHYSCFSSQSWDLGALWASLTDFWVCVRDRGVLFMTIWSNTSRAYPHMWISENTISEAHKLGGIRLAKCTL